MKIRESLREYFVFSRNERAGIIVVLALIAAVFFLPKAYSLFKPVPKTSIDTAWMASVARLEEKQHRKEYSSSQDRNTTNYPVFNNEKDPGNITQGELFQFDPNTLPAEGWKRLGIREKTVNTILNYLSKGGRFRKPDDLRKIYGLFPDEFERIAPYISIAGPEQTVQERGNITRESTTTFAKTTPRYTAVEINSADTTAFIALPGIGSKLATRIISFREKLGGFYTIEQVKEVYGLPDSTFQRIRQYLKVESSNIQKINVNTATIDELKAHPYIRWKLAGTIVAFRKEHGLFAKAEDLKKIAVITEEDFQKIAPYLITQ